MAAAKRRLVDSFWDLRDNAYDHPERWHGVSADEIFQRLSEYVEAAAERGEPIDWQRDVAERLIAWRADQGEG